ncbi:MAG: hypothetical protein A2Z65_11420 [Gallionellales bacterium RIFCSPLOWO2_02_58_13]|nr:MAG: hypothetical protein A2Z65_11420 [Gallionellales bacterium RIFCSPLOWO2_02_58_13]
MDMKRTALDPFRALIGVLEKRGKCDVLRAAANSAGLVFDASMSEKDAYSHTTRIRALVPRIFKAYDLLDEQDQLSVTRTVLVSTHDAEITATLEKLGWSVQDGELVVKAADVREVFFPKGSPWDAHVVLQELFAEATHELTIVDAYADTTIFQMLSARSVAGLTVRILCAKYAPAVAAEAARFEAQHPGVAIKIRQSRDFHDRFIVIDGSACVHVGSSLKDAGRTACMISRVEDALTRTALLKALADAWAGATVV